MRYIENADAAHELTNSFVLKSICLKRSNNDIAAPITNGDEYDS